MKGSRSNPTRKQMGRAAPTVTRLVLWPITALIIASMTLGAPLQASGNEQKEAAALAILQAAKKHYSNKSFIKAAQMFSTAFEISGNPAYLFNAGRAYQRGYKLDEAEKHFKRCLSLVKDKSNPMVRRASVHLQEIQEARSAIAAAVKTASGSSLVSPPAQKPPPKAKPAEPDQPVTKPGEPSTADQPTDSGKDATKKPVEQPPITKPAWKTYTSWGLVGGGGVMGAVAAWMMASATGDKNKLDEQVKSSTKEGKVVMSKATYDDKVGTINSKIYTGYGLFAAGIALVGTGAWMMSGPSKDDAKVAFMPTPGGIRFGLAARF